MKNGKEEEVAETLYQAGTDSDCSKGNAIYYAWQEEYGYPDYVTQRVLGCAANVTCFAVNVKPGDTIKVSIVDRGLDTHWSLTDVRNGRTLWTHGSLWPTRYQHRHSAECIVEAPKGSELADFAGVQFSNCQAVDQAGTLWDMVAQKLPAHWIASELEMKPAETVVAVPSVNPLTVSYVAPQLAELKGSDTTAGDYFGTSVAISGTMAIVGAPDHANFAGRAYVFTRTEAGWEQTAEIEGSDTVANDSFGSSVAISGTTAIVGAYLANRAYVFTQTPTGWKQTAELEGSDTVANDSFGSSVAISGTTAVVGESGDPFSNAYVFTQTPTGWQQTAELSDSDEEEGDSFGSSVAISGTTAVVGASGHSDSAGRAYLFTQTATGWKQVAELKASDTGTFGYSVAISGSTVVVDAPYDWLAERAYVFTETATGWKQAAELKGSAAVPDIMPGADVAISGSTVVVGTAADANIDRAYVFTKTATSWKQAAELVGSDTAAYDDFGESVAISGTTAVVGAPDHAGRAGRAYVFET